MNDSRTNGSICAETVPGKKFADHSINNAWGYTYFTLRDGLIKIGHSGAPKSRLAKVGGEVLAVVPNEIVREGEAHQKFAHLREHKEWFRPEPDLLAFIKEVKERADQLPKRERRPALSANEQAARRLTAKVPTLPKRLHPFAHTAIEQLHNRDGYVVPPWAGDRRQTLDYQIEKSLARLGG
jgi:hypothetical protein